MRIVIPKSCQDELLLKLHEGHFGVDCTKLRVRNSVYWLQIGRDIENVVKTCKKCQEFSRWNSKDPAIPRELPLVAWTLLELDLFTFENGTFLLIVDVTSSFPVVRILSNESTRSVLNALKRSPIVTSDCLKGCLQTMDPVSDHRNLVNSMQNLVYLLRNLVRTIINLLAV